MFGTELSYSQLVDQVERLAGALVSLGVRREDRVLLCMQNCTQVVVAHFAILRADAVVVPVNPMSKSEELRHYIGDSGAKVGIVTADLATGLASASDLLDATERLQCLVVTQYTDGFDAERHDEEAPIPTWRDWLCKAHELPTSGCTVVTWADALQSNRPPQVHAARGDDMAMLPYTSGTTGHPKGCIHHHSSVNHNAFASQHWALLSPETVMLAAVPLFHITGIVMMHAAVVAAGTLVIMPRWNRELAGRLISRRKVSYWSCIPTMVVDLLASPDFASFDLSSLVHIGGGGTAMPQAVAQRLLDTYGLRFVEGYGLTETAAPSHANPWRRPKQQCLGMPFISTDSRVIDPETKKELPHGEAGEIVTHGPQLFKGYWRQPEATAAAFVEIEGKKFFRTGDLGRIDEDGYFFMTDRLKRMINASGFKVWPAEVETLLFRHPAVQEACIISTRDDYRGESVKAIVVLRSTHAHTTADQVVEWCRQNMAAYKVPRQVQFVEALPKSGSGKVLWRALQEHEDGG